MTCMRELAWLHVYAISWNIEYADRYSVDIQYIQGQYVEILHIESTLTLGYITQISN